MFEQFYQNFKNELILHTRKDFLEEYKKNKPGLKVP